MMAPGARVELAWISPNDFEFLLNLVDKPSINEFDGLEPQNFSMIAKALRKIHRTRLRQKEPISSRLS